MMITARMDRPWLSVVIPAFNEESRIRSSLERMRTYLDGTGRSWEIVVVDDGSSDRTAALVEQAGADEPRIRLVRAPHGGKGAAVRRGMLEATGRWRFLSDADLSMPPENLGRFFAGEGGVPSFDVAIGSREAAGARRIEEPWSRHMLGRVFNWTVKIVALRGIEDTQCGFKLFSAEAAETIFPRQRLNGFTFDVENLFIARKAGFSIGEVPIDWQYFRGGQVTCGGSIQAYLDIFRVRLNHLLGRYRVKKKR